MAFEHWKHYGRFWKEEGREGVHGTPGKEGSKGQRPEVRGRPCLIASPINTGPMPPFPGGSQLRRAGVWKWEPALRSWFARENPGVQVTAIDISEEMAARGRERVEQWGLTDRIDYQVGDVGDQDRLGQLGFDLVYTVMSPGPTQAGVANLLTSVKDRGRSAIRVWWPIGCPPKAVFSLDPSGLNAGSMARSGLPPYFYQAVTIRK